MKKNSYLIPRRSFLKGCGVAMALPTLEIMSPATCYAKEKQNETVKNRLCVLYKGNGVNPSSWDITGATEDNFQMSKNLKPLERLKKDVLILSGIDSDMRAQGGHPSAPLAFMTGNIKQKRFIQNQSFDQVVADEIGHLTPIKSLQMRSDIYFDAKDPCENYLSYDKAGKPLSVEDNPELVFNNLFKGFNNEAHRQRTGSILDEVKDSYESIAKKASNHDRQVLEHYLHSVRQVEKNIEQFKKQSNSRREVKLKQIKPIAASSNMAERTRAMLDLIALAFWTDMTRVSTLMMSHTESRTVYDFLGINDEMHYMSHFVRNTKVIPGFDRVNQWHVQQFAYFLEKLKSFKDGTGTLFDNSTVLFGSGIKHGDYHSVTDLPMVLSGGGAGKIKLGRYVKYPHKPICNLQLNIMEMMGVKRDKFGISTGTLTGISEKAGFVIKNSDDGSWIMTKGSNNSLEVKGLLKIIVSEDDPNLYVVQLSDQTNLQIRAGYKDVNSSRMDAYVGSVVILKGSYSIQKDTVVMTKVKSCKVIDL